MTFGIALIPERGFFSQTLFRPDKFQQWFSPADFERLVADCWSEGGSPWRSSRNSLTACPSPADHTGKIGVVGGIELTAEPLFFFLISDFVIPSC